MHTQTISLLLFPILMLRGLIFNTGCADC